MSNKFIINANKIVLKLLTTEFNYDISYLVGEVRWVVLVER